MPDTEVQPPTSMVPRRATARAATKESWTQKIPLPEGRVRTSPILFHRTGTLASEGLLHPGQGEQGPASRQAEISEPPGPTDSNVPLVCQNLGQTGGDAIRHLPPARPRHLQQGASSTGPPNSERRSSKGWEVNSPHNPGDNLRHVTPSDGNEDRRTARGTPQDRRGSLRTRHPRDNSNGGGRSPHRHSTPRK